MSELPVGPDTRVTLHFALKLEDGSDVDTTFGKDPASLNVGDGNLPENFEQYIHGMTTGQRETFQVPPENAFGQHNPSNVQTFKRSDFSADMVLEPGVMISFADKMQGELPGVVDHVDGDQVTVDFNHPLAGRTLTFEVEIVRVDPAHTTH